MWRSGNARLARVLPASATLRLSVTALRSSRPPPPPALPPLLQHDRIQAQHNAEMAEMVSAMRNIQKTVTDYHGRLFASLSEIGGSGHSDSGM